MQEQQPVETAEPDEGSGDQRVDERLAVVEAVVGRVRWTLDFDKGPVCVEPDVDGTASFQEDALWSASVDLPEAKKVLSLEREVAVVGEAERH